MQDRQSGFTLAELLIVFAIIAILVAIGVPAFGALRSSSQDGVTQSALQQVKEEINSTLPVWRGYPPSGTLRVCYASGDFPTGELLEDTCAFNAWSATQTDGSPTSPALGGTLPEGVTVQGVVAADGSFCVDGMNAQAGTITWHVTSSSAEVLEGSCFSAGWTAPIGLIATGEIAVAPAGLPSAPTGVTVTTPGAPGDTSYIAVEWLAAEGETFEISVSGQPTRIWQSNINGTVSCIFPAATCAGPATGTFEPGLYSATVRKVLDGNSSPGVVVDFAFPVN